MKKTLHPFYLRKLKKFKQLQKRLNALVAKGDFIKLNGRKRKALIHKLDKLSSLLQPKLRIAGIAGLTMLAGISYGQNQYSRYTTPAILPNALNVSSESTPAFFDVDSDGDLDLFVGSFGEKITLFKNESGKFREAYGSENPIPFTTTEGVVDIAFTDIDADADSDAVVKNADTLYLYKNNGDGTFTEATGTNNPFSSLTLSYTYKFTFADLDKDGDNDLIVGSSNYAYGAFRYFSRSNNSFTELTGTDNPLNNVFASKGEISFFDIDDDGDLDAFTGSKSDEELAFFNNNNGNFSNATNSFFTNLQSHSYNSVAFGDVNGDDLIDAVVGNQTGYFDYYENDGNDNLVFVPSVPSPIGQGIQFGNYHLASFDDLNGDGIDEAFILIEDGLIYAENDGSGNFTNDVTNTISGLPTNFIGYSIQTSDLDKDGDFDLFVSGSYGVYSYLNDGSNNFTQYSNSPLSNINPQGNQFRLEDVDGDNDDDLFIVSGFTTIAYFENDGNAVFTEKTGTDNPFAAITESSIYSFDFTDMNNDGELDVVFNTMSGDLHTYLNDGNLNFSAMGASDPFTGVTYSGTLDFTDINQDGLEDAVINDGVKEFIFLKAATVTSNLSSANKFELNIFPNPTSSVVNIQGDFKSEVQFELYSSTGEKVMSGEGTSFNVEGLKSGIYLLKVISGNNSSTKQIVVK